MTFRLNHAVMHELRKEKHSKGAEAVLADSLLDRGGLVNALVSMVASFMKRFRRRAVHLRFDPDRLHEVPRQLQLYCTGDRGGAEFLELTREFMRKLTERAKRELMVSGGHLLFADYESEGGRFVVVAMFKEPSGIAMSGLVPVGLTELDPGGIRQTAQVSFESLSQEVIHEEDMLTLISTQANCRPSRYFIEALGGKHVRQPMSPNITRVFQVARSVFERDESIPFGFRGAESALKELMKSRIKSSVKLDEIIEVLGRFLPEDGWHRLADKLRAQMKSSAVPDGFHVSKDAYEKHVYFRFKGGGAKIDVEKSKVGYTKDDPVFLDEENGCLVLSDKRMIRQLIDAIRRDRMV